MSSAKYDRCVFMIEYFCYFFPKFCLSFFQSISFTYDITNVNQMLLINIVRELSHHFLNFIWSLCCSRSPFITPHSFIRLKTDQDRISFLTFYFCNVFTLNHLVKSKTLFVILVINSPVPNIRDGFLIHFIPSFSLFKIYYKGALKIKLMV